jgi:hypothetical protein
VFQLAFVVRRFAAGRAALERVAVAGFFAAAAGAFDAADALLVADALVAAAAFLVAGAFLAADAFLAGGAFGVATCFCACSKARCSSFVSLPVSRRAFATNVLRSV